MKHTIWNHVKFIQLTHFRYVEFYIFKRTSQVKNKLKQSSIKKCISQISHTCSVGSFHFLDLYLNTFLFVDVNSAYISNVDFC